MKTHSFVYQGHHLKIHLILIGKSDNEARKDEEERFKNLIDRYAVDMCLRNKRSGRAIIFQKLVECEREEKTNNASDIIELLEAIGILSYERARNWEIVGPMNEKMNPGTHLYFTRRADAVAYAIAKYRKAVYPWYIVQYRVVIQKPTLV